MEIVKDNSVWFGPEIQSAKNWTYTFSKNDIREIETALNYSKTAEISLQDLSKSSFPLTKFSEHINIMLEELENGPGIYLFRGFPSEQFNKEDLRRIFWGIGLYCGPAVSQSKQGDFLGDVKDIGTSHDGPSFRGYTSNGELTYHCDASDATALFCLSPAKKGGLSKIVSSSSIHNQIQKERPDLLDVLYKPYYWGRQGNELPGQNPYYTQPIFAYSNGRFAARYTRTHIRTAELGGITPALTSLQNEALDFIDELCERPEFQLTMMFEPGDIQFLNNHLTLHTRTAFQDHKDPKNKRHLLRLWFSPSNSRKLPAGFKPFFGDTRPGAVRGGFPGHGTEKSFQTS